MKIPAINITVVVFRRVDQGDSMVKMIALIAPVAIECKQVSGAVTISLIAEIHLSLVATLAFLFHLLEKRSR